MGGSFLIDPLLARHDCGILGDGNVVEERRGWWLGVKSLEGSAVIIPGRF